MLTFAERLAVKRVGSSFLAAVMSLSVAGCSVGPNYTRRVDPLPQGYRDTPASNADASTSIESVADEQWSTIFKDSVLESLVQEALRNNPELHIAAERVLEAQAQLGITRSQQLPSLNAGGSYQALQLPPSLPAANADGTPGRSFYNAGGFSASAAWNLDFWGLYRRQSEAARADLLATVWGERATRSSLVEGVAQAYFQLRSLDAQLEITVNTIKARRDSLKLVESLRKYGAGSLADTRQAEELLHAAQANLPALRRLTVIEENQISILLGRNPERIERGLAIDAQPHPQEIPAGVPSQLLERRPDIEEAEAKLIAANARIGVAKAQFFPNISLTSLGGSASSQLNSVFAGKNAYWYAAASLTQPIFDGGRIRSNYHLSQAEQQEMLLEYRKTILNALRDVSNSLVTYKESRESREEKSAQVFSAADAVRLARLRYAAGASSYLEVLTTDTQLYDAELTLAEAQEREASSLVELYAALGGGWQ
jgi:outer membrane protein, multidrug efflux system